MKTKAFFMLFVLSLGLVCLTQALAQQEKVQLEPQGEAPKVISQNQDKISLDIKGMDIVDVLKLLAGRSNINIVVGKNVSGRVTLFLKDVDPQDAFEIILLANDLAYEKKGDIVNIMTQRDYELQYGDRYRDRREVKIVKLEYAKAADLARTLSQIKTNIGKVIPDEGANTLVLIDVPEKIKDMEGFIAKADLATETRLFSLSYAQADKLNAKIQEIITKGVGSVRIDERTNKIAVTDYPEALDKIAGIITAFDEKTPQVLIDAQIIEVRPSDKFEMGVDWDFWIKQNFRMSSALPIGTTGRLLLGTTAGVPTKKGDYKAIVDLLRTIGDTKILSSPRIMALNNQEARILVGTKDVYITSSVTQSGETAVTAQTVNFVDVGIKLYVTPTINNTGFVTMKIRPEISSAERTNITSDGKVSQIPIVTTSEAETTVMLKDGVTIIIGGLKKDEKTKTVKKIPILGDIPWLGNLFRSTSDERKKTELVILLTPHIISGENAYTDFSEIMPKDGAVAKMEKGEIIIEKIHDTEGKYFPESNAQYYDLVSTKIEALTLAQGAGGNKGEVELIFTLASDGTLIGEPVILRADNEALVPLSIQVIKEAVPFPAFPASLEKDKEGFKISINYK